MKSSVKSLLALVVLYGAMLVSSSGCATPAYSTGERWQLIGRNMAYEERIMQDDIDALLLLRPATRLTIWHVR